LENQVTLMSRTKNVESLSVVETIDIVQDRLGDDHFLEQERSILHSLGERTDAFARVFC